MLLIEGKCALKLGIYSAHQFNIFFVYRVSQKKGNPFYQWDIFIVAQVFIKTICFLFKGIFPSFINTKHPDDILMHDWKGTILIHAMSKSSCAE